MPIELVAFHMACTTAKGKVNINGFFRAALLTAGLDVEAAAVNKEMGHRKNKAIEIVVQKNYRRLQQGSAYPSMSLILLLTALKNVHP